MPFNSEKIREFAKRWNFNVCTSSPNYPQGNTLAERYVRTAKQLLLKCQEDQTDFQEAVLTYRSTPIPSLNASPAQLLYSRQIRNTLPISKAKLKPKIIPNVASMLFKKQLKSAESYNPKRPRNAKFHLGQSIYFQKRPGGNWIPASITDYAESPRSYLISADDGTK